MLILTIRTDKPEAELGLYKDNQQLDYFVWQAHRELAETIHNKIKELLEKRNDINILTGYVMTANRPSVRIFERLGFESEEAEPQYPDSIKFLKKIK